MLRLGGGVCLSDVFRGHLRYRESKSVFRRRGHGGGRVFVVLDEELVLSELRGWCDFGKISCFLREHLQCDEICCVHAVWLHSSCARAQAVHRDHSHGYGKYVTVVFTVDDSLVDTMVLVGDEIECASCKILVYDGYLRHFGPSGTSKSKVFVSFSDPSLKEFGSIARGNGHGRKQFYPRL
jgi:hypothetical protein